MLCTTAFTLFSLQQAEAQYSVKLPHEGISVVNVNGKAVFKGGYSKSKPGQPAVPSYDVTFLLPTDADVNGVSVNITNLTEQELAGEYDVNPCEVLPSEPAGKYPSIIDGKDTTVYRKNAFFPSEYKGNAFSGCMKQYKITTVSVNPYRYNPVTKKLRMITGGTLEITFNTAGSTTTNFVRDIRIENLLGARVVNPSVFQTYGSTPQGGVALNLKAASSLVTTKPSNVPSSLASINPNQIQPLSASASSIPGHGYYVLTTTYIKNNSSILPWFLYYTVSCQGGTPIVLTPEDMGANNLTGQDRADAIRAYLKGHYISDNVSNILIIGSPDVNNGDIPMINYTNPPDFPQIIPTDFLYADMDEPINGVGDIAVGRIPAVYEDGVQPGSQPFNMSEIDDILLKTTNYCLTSGSVEWRRMAMLPMMTLGYGDNYQHFGEDLIVHTIKTNNNGWEFYRLYEPFEGNGLFAYINNVAIMNPLPELPFCNYNNVAENWNSQIPGLVVFNTHGYTELGKSVLSVSVGYYIDGSGKIIVYPGNVNLLNSNYPAVVFAASCHTAPPEMVFGYYPTGKFVSHLGYQTLVHNAVAYVGGSRDVDEGDNEVVGKGFVDYMTRRGLNCTVGEALNNAKTGGPVAGSTFLYNLWGCPNVSFNLPDFSTNLSAPQNFKAVPNTSGDPKSQILLTWDPVTNATSYVIERADNTGGLARSNCYNYLTEVISNSYTDINLANGKKYRYRLYAKTSAERGSYSAIDSASTYDLNNMAVAPFKPADLSLYAMDCGTALSWTMYNGPSVNCYDVKRSTDSDPSHFTTIAKTTEANFRDTNLVNGYTYYYCVSAENDYGQSDPTDPVSVTPSSPGDGNVTAPPTFNAGGGAVPFVNSVAFFWTAQTAADKNYIGSLIEYKEQMPDGSYADKGGSDQWSNFVIGNRLERSANDPPDVQNYSIVNQNRNSTNGGLLSPCFTTARGNVQYQFRIRNFTHPGSDPDVYDYSPGIIQTLKTNNDPNKLDPTAPVWNTSICNVAGPYVNLSWNYTPKDMDLTSYKIYMKSGTDPWSVATVSSSDYTYDNSTHSFSYKLFVGKDKTVDLYIRASYSDAKSSHSQDGIDIDGDYSTKITFTTPSQTPFNGPHNIGNGATLEAEDFDNGGEGIAYHDNDAANQGGAYRNEGVDIEPCSAGGYDVGWTESGEWLDYTCNVTEGTYDITLHAASLNPNNDTKVLKLFQDNAEIGMFYIPNTGGWQTYQQITVKNVKLKGGMSVLSLSDVSGGFNIDKFTFTTSDPCSGVTGGGGGLQGTAFGLNPPYSAGSEYCKATDGDTTTFYDYSQANGGYTGLDLGSAKVITKIRYYPRENISVWRTVGGKFQGSNTSSSSGFVDLYTITATKANAWNEVTIPNSTGYRWVRYLSPDGGYCNIAEMEFYDSGIFPDPNKWYKIATKANTSLCLDVTGGNYVINTPIELWTKSNVNQEFKFQNAGNGYYTITCRGSATSYSIAIDMSGNFANGQTLELLTTDVNSANQKFKLIPVGNGYYRLESSDPGYSIDNWGAGGDGVKPALYTSDNYNDNQKWLITEVQ